MKFSFAFIIGAASALRLSDLADPAEDKLTDKWTKRILHYDPDIDIHMADKIRHYQKTLWAIKALE